jgi:hypothetical protein
MKEKRNVLYCCCITDPFLHVAQRLQKEKGYNPVYWVGDTQSCEYNDPSEQDVKKAFPEIVVHNFIQAWRGVFPECVEEKALSTYIDIDFLRQFSNEELQAMSMMDRLDFDRYSFCYMERERHFLNLIKKWKACIELFNVDAVIAATTPHRIFDYTLYLLCKYKGINYVTFQVMIPGRIYPLLYFSDQNAISYIDSDYSNYLNSDISLETLPEDIKASYLKLQGDYKTAIPAYMVKHVSNNVKSANMLYLFRRFMSTHKLFGNHNLFIEGQKRTVYKNKKYSQENTSFSVWEWYKLRRAALKYDKKLRSLYIKMTSKVSFDVPYIALYLQYQPEATTSPNGDIFTNQYLCVETLLKNTPENVFVYVKEHPNQYGSHVQGHQKRIKEFYYDLVKNPRVRLVPFEVDSFTLMEKAMAVSTVTGTVGWEAVARKKPVIIFGRVWYECYGGVLKVIDDATASQIYLFIQNYKYNEHSILAYLHTVAAHTIRAYHYKGYKDSTGIGQEESVNNIYNSLLPLLQQ